MQAGPQYLTSACWSPTRAGVFFAARMDGVLDIWDYYYRQNEVAYTHKVGETALSSVAVSKPSGPDVKQHGRLVAVGDVKGTVSLLEVCESLALTSPSEKMAISNMLDRERLSGRERVANCVCCG